MTSLSKFIKSSHAELSNGKLISIKMIEIAQKEEDKDDVVKAPVYPSHFIEDAKLKAKQIMEQAHMEAEQIREQLHQEKEKWQSEFQQLKEEAFQKGYEDGFKQGQLDGLNSVNENLELAKSVIETAKKDYQKHIESSDQTILLIAMKAAEKILNIEIENNPNVIANVVKQVLKEARDYREIQITVHPSDYAYMVSQKDDLLSIFPKETELYIYPDDQVKPTTCIIETEGGRIDASIDSQLAMLKEKLLEEMIGEHGWN